MKKIFLIAFSFVLGFNTLFAFSPAQAAEVVTLTATQSTYVYSGVPGSVYKSGFLNATATAGNSNSIRIPFFKFDLSSIPAGSTINSASIKLYFVKDVDHPCSGSPNFYFAQNTGDWNEDTLVWNNKPDSSNNDPTGSISCPGASGYRTYTGAEYIVQQWVSGTDPNYGFQMFGVPYGNTTYDNWTYASSRGAGREPQLVVNYTSPATPAVPVTPSTPTAAESPSSTTTVSGEAPATTVSSSIVKPTELKAEYAAGAKLTWKASTTADITGYVIFRSETKGKGYTKVANVAKNVLEYTDSTVVASKTYYYVARAAKGVEQSASSNEASLDIPADAAPIMPLDLKVAGVGSDYVTVSWTKNPEANLSGYTITILKGSEVIKTADIDSDRVNYFFGGLTKDTDYKITLTAKNSAGKESTPSEVTTKTLKEPIPVNSTFSLSTMNLIGTAAILILLLIWLVYHRKLIKTQATK